MRANAGFLIFIGLLLLMSACAAADPLTVTINSSQPWVVAGGDPAAITVHVKNASGTPLTGAIVSLNVIDNSYGSISSQSGPTTNPDGNVIANFIPAQKSGIAIINVSTEYTDTGSGSVFTSSALFEQNIDHNRPHSDFIDAPLQIPAGSSTQMNITFTDRFSNRIDNKNPAESHVVNLTMSGAGGSGIWNGAGYVPVLSVPTDAEGNVSVMVRVSTTTGSNNIFMGSIGDLTNGDSRDIEGVSDSTPVTMSQLPPSPTSWPADGTHVFNLYYTVKDKNGNTLDGTDVWINSSASESFLSTTSNGGVAYSQYGPKDVTGTYTITAKTVKNSSVLCTDTGTVGYCSETVSYYSQDPVDMILTASPQTLVSLDVDGTSQSIMQARVVDVSGNPVANETVTFSPGPESFPGAPGGTYNETTPSKLVPGTSPLNILTDSNGFATVQFIPGSFSTLRSIGDYNATATGVRTVTASWTNKKTGEVKTQSVTFNWKNYPYLTVTSSVDKTSAKVGDPLRVTIVVSGNGAALQPKPIDAVISMDRSGSMLENSSSEPDDHMVTAKNAAYTFASCLTYGRDDFGIVSFGDNSATNGWVNLSPTSKKSSWDWSNVYGYWYWVGDDTAPTSRNNYDNNKCGTNCDGSQSSPYSSVSRYQLYLNAHYNNGNPKNYGTTSFASTDLSLASHLLTDVNTALNGIVPGGGTPTREGLYDAVNMFPASSSGRVRAIILQTDGSWNTGGDPEALTNTAPDESYEPTRFTATGLGSSNSVITYANNSKIAIYTIGLGITSGSSMESALKRYAANDAGKYYSASNPSQLPGIYTDIAGQLNQQAGGSTVLDLKMGSITVNNSVVSSGPYLNYTAIPVGGRQTGVDPAHDSTYVNMYHTNKDGSNTNYYTYTRDDTRNWTQSKELNFSIGTMKLGDTWQTTFQFNLTQNGTLVLFGPNTGSTISFTDSSTGLTQISTLDSKTVSVYQSAVNQGFGTKSLLVNNLHFIERSPDPNVWSIQWDTTYNGASKAQETVEYLSSEPGSQWTTVPGTIADKSPSAQPLTDTLDIDTSTWKQDVMYTIRVTATAANNDASPSSASIVKAKSLATGNPFIKLE